MAHLQTADAIATLDRQLAGELEELERRGLRRTLNQVAGRPGPQMQVNGRSIWMFAGANYLDLAGDPRVIAASQAATESSGCAAGGARLICGNLATHEALENDLAHFTGFPSSLLFSTGYMANLGVITALAGPSDVVVSDSLNHASIIDACRLSRAEIRTFRHNDPEDFRNVAAQLAGFRRRILVVDGVYSMDGDVSPLRQLVPIAREHEMNVVVDDAHGFGVLGEEGRGTSEFCDVECDAVIGNLGKALGSFGAFVACSDTVREFLVNCCRTFVFTCGLPAAAVAAAGQALRIVQDEPGRRRDLLARADQLRAGLGRAGYNTGRSSTHIVPLVIGDNQRALEMCEAAWQQGVFAQAIRFPSVPHATARLRLVPMSSHSREAVNEVIDVFAKLKAVSASAR